MKAVKTHTQQSCAIICGLLIVLGGLMCLATVADGQQSADHVQNLHTTNEPAAQEPNRDGDSDSEAVRGMCPSPSSESCFLPHVTPGCDDSDCCLMVCNLMPSCCSTQWDASCVALAQQLCDCTQCPPGAIIEQEPCGQNITNPGCDTPPPHTFSDVSCGDDFCGELWADMGDADADWLQIDVSDPGGSGERYVCVDLYAEAPVVAEMYTGSCGNLTLVAQADTELCDVAQLCACVPAPGVVYVKIYLGSIAGGPIVDNYPCGVTNNSYRAHISCTDCPQEEGACCFQIAGTSIFNCIVTTQQDCLTNANYLNPTYLGDNTTCTSYTCAPCIAPPPGMVAWWPMDETFGSVVHDSVNSNHGLRAGATPPSTVAGAVDNALDFDGASSHVDVPDHPTLNFGAATQATAGDFSIDTWIRMDQFTAQQAPIVDKRDQQPRGYYFFVLDGNLALIIEDGIGPQATVYHTNSTLLPINQLLHVAVTVDRDDPQGVQFYLNGAPFGQLGDPTQHAGNLTSADSLYIGASKYMYFPGDGQAFFDGMIDEVEIFNSELSASEVASIYNAGNDGKCKSTCHVPWDEPFCENENEITVTTTVCNWSPVAQTYQMTFSPEPAGFGCTIPGPTQFNVLGPNPITVGPNQCVPVQVKITRPVNMTSVYNIGCYKMTITNQSSGHSFVCHGSVQDRRDLCGQYVPGPTGGTVGGVVLVPWPGPIVGSFEIAVARSDLGRGDTLSVPIEVRATGGDMLPSDNLSLDGLPPGEPVVRTVKIPPGEEGIIDFSLQFLEHNPFDAHDITLYTDMDMDGNYEALVSIGALSVDSLPCAADIANSTSDLPDGTINVFDLLALLTNWSTNGNGANIAAPANDLVDVFDLLDLLAGWGDC